METNWREAARARIGEARILLVWLSGQLSAAVGAGRLHGWWLRRLVRGTALFDDAFYRQANEGCLGDGVSALRHYVTHGDREGRPPMVLFDPMHYRAQCGGWLQRVNALLHFDWVGRHRRCSPSAWFDTAFYLAQNRDVARSGMNPLLHYWKWGGGEGRSPSPLFDGKHYLTTNPEVARTHANPLVHYLSSARPDRRGGRPVAADPEGVSTLLTPIPDEAWSSLPRRRGGDGAVVDVIVPVYGGPAETLGCLFSVLAANGQTPFELIVIDDASPEQALVGKLRTLAGRGLFTFTSNPNNLGFVSTVNRGMGMHDDRDVVLLNADTEVYDGWLDRLRAAATRQPRTGTVTPLSNNATICSYPIFLSDNPFPLELDYRALDALTGKVNGDVEVETPTGVGFCMYIKRACLNDVGMFDDRVFGRGYGEENDFCQRAIAAGWRNVIAADLFVHHWGAASFAGEKAARVAAAAKTLRRLHPAYHEDVARFIRHDPLSEARARMDWARLLCMRRERNVLLVSHERGGGTERLVQEEVERILSSGRGVFLLRPARSAPGRVAISHPHVRVLPNLPTLEFGGESALVERLTALGVTDLHVHSLVDFPPEAPAMVVRLAKALGARLEVCVHDYAVVCPRINLARDDGHYCGEPAMEACNRCLAPERHGSDIGQWRAAHGRLLVAAARVRVPDPDVADRLAVYFPGLPMEVCPHEKIDWRAVVTRVASVRAGEKLRVVVIGAIGKLKGFEPLLACARLAQAQRRPIDFSLLGYSLNDRALRDAGVTVTGKYREEEAVDKLLELEPHMVWLPSLWPETYSYTLSIALRAGLPVVAFDLGAIARRLRDMGWRHCLLPLRMATDPVSLNRQFESFGATEGLTGYEAGETRDVSLCD